MNGQHANFENVTTLKAQGSMFHLSNGGGNSVWYNIGTFSIGGNIGTSARIRIVGPGGFSSAIDNPYANGINFAVGEAIIGLQNKDQVTKTTVSWYGVGSSPIYNVKYIQNFPSSIAIYVEVRAIQAIWLYLLKQQARTEHSQEVHSTGESL